MTEDSVDSGSRSGSSSTGLETNLGGLLAYLLGFVTGILFLIVEKEDRLVRFHAYQSLATFGGLFVLSLGSNLIPLLGQLIIGLITPIGFILWVVLMVQAFRGRHLKLPWIGDWAEEQAKLA